MNEETRVRILKCSDGELASMIQKPEFSIDSKAWQFAQQELQRRQLNALSRPKWIEKWILAFTVLAVLIAMIALVRS